MKSPKLTELSYALKFIKRRTRNNRNFVGLWVGDPGTGKSWGSIKYAEEIDATFDHTRIVFGILELIKQVNRGMIKPNTCVILEEVGVEANNKRWFDKFVRALNFLLQTWRHRRIILFVNAPDATEVAKSINKRIDMLFETLTVDYSKNEVIVKPMTVQTNKRSGKVYYKYLRTLTPAGPVVIKRIRVGKPNQEIIKKYEAAKTQYTTRLYKGLERELSAPTDLTEKQLEVYELLKKGYNQLEIAGKLGKSQPVVSRMVNRVKNKGYTWDSNISRMSNRKGLSV